MQVPTEDYDETMLMIKAVRHRGKSYGLDESGEQVPGFEDEGTSNPYGKGFGKSKGKKGGGGSRWSGNAGNRTNSRPASEGGYDGQSGGLFGSAGRADPWSAYRPQQDANW